jgi:hypothetical protein
MVAPLTAPSSRMAPVARVFTYTSAPFEAACQTRSRSKTFRSRTYPTFDPAICCSMVIEAPSGATSRAPLISAEIHRSSGSMNSASTSFPIPSAQRTGAPMAGRFSTRQTEWPAAARSPAATAPPGPPPTTRTSYRLFIGHLQGPEGAGPGADPAAHAGVLHGEEGIDELEGALGADRDAGPAVPAALPVYEKHGDHIVTGIPIIFTPAKGRCGKQGGGKGGGRAFRGGSGGGVT